MILKVCSLQNVQLRTGTQWLTFVWTHSAPEFSSSVSSVSFFLSGRHTQRAACYTLGGVIQGDTLLLLSSCALVLTDVSLPPLPLCPPSLFSTRFISVHHPPPSPLVAFVSFHQVSKWLYWWSLSNLRYGQFLPYVNFLFCLSVGLSCVWRMHAAVETVTSCWILIVCMCVCVCIYYHIGSGTVHTNVVSCGHKSHVKQHYVTFPDLHTPNDCCIVLYQNCATVFSHFPDFISNMEIYSQKTLFFRTKSSHISPSSVFIIDLSGFFMSLLQLHHI